MPKFYCEYCGIYLTHSSPSGRGQHAKGRKHINNRIEYYKQVIEDINKENQDKLKQMQSNQSSSTHQQQLIPGGFQMLQQHPMLQQLQQLKAGGIQQVQISSNQQGPGGAPPVQPGHPMLQPPFMNMPKGGPGMLPILPPGAVMPPLRPGQQPPPLGPPMGMMPPPNQMQPGMKPMPGMPPLVPGQFMPPPQGMMGMPPPNMANMPPMGFQPPPQHLGGPFNPMGMESIKSGENFPPQEEQK